MTQIFICAIYNLLSYYQNNQLRVVQLSYENDDFNMKRRNNPSMINHVRLYSNCRCLQ